MVLLFHVNYFHILYKDLIFINNYDLGSTLKFIRTEKGLNQKDVCFNVCSRTFLSKIETNGSIPNVLVMANILSNLNINFHEFFYLNHTYKQEKFICKEKLCTSFFSLRDNHENLDNVIHDCKQFLKKYTDDFIDDLLIVSLFLNKLKTQPNFDFEKSELNSVWARLQNMNILTLNEIKLINCILFYFPNEIAKNISDFILRQLDKYKGYSEYLNLVMSIYLNISTLCFYNNEFEKTKKLMKIVIKYAEKQHRFDILYLSKYRLSIIVEDIEMRKKSHNILISLGLTTYVSELEKEYIYYNKYK